MKIKWNKSQNDVNFIINQEKIFLSFPIYFDKIDQLNREWDN